eukprot:327808-Pleurochrysis_carterae.AAC.3
MPPLPWPLPAPPRLLPLPVGCCGSTGGVRGRRREAAAEGAQPGRDLPALLSAEHQLAPKHEPVADAAGCARRQQGETRGACWNGAVRHPQPPWHCAVSCVHPAQAHRGLADHSSRKGLGCWIYVTELSLLEGTHRYPACGGGH